MQFSRLIAKVLNLMCAVCVYPWRLLSKYVGPYGPVVQVTLGVVTLPPSFVSCVLEALGISFEGTSLNVRSLSQHGDLFARKCAAMATPNFIFHPPPCPTMTLRSSLGILLRLGVYDA